MRNTLRSAISAIWLAGLAGCFSNYVDATKTAKGFTAPTDPNNIEVLRTKPERHYLELGTLTTSDWALGDTAKMYNALRSRGAEMGADAVLIISSGQNVDPFWGTTFMWCSAVAIQYQ